MKLPKGITINRSFKRFEDIYDMFRFTGYGMILNQRVRWHLYKTREMSHTAWERFIGDDANNLKHLRVSYELTKHFLNTEGSFTQKEAELLLFTSIVHDWAEPVVGDTLRFMKTAKDDKNEFHVLTQILNEIFFGKLDKDLKHIVIKILSDRSSRLGEAFRVVEVMGYFKTGLHVSKKLKKTKGEARLRLYWLVANVLLSDMDFMVKVAPKYTTISLFLEKENKFISDGFKYMPIEVFDFNIPTKRDHYFKKFQDAKKLWINYNRRTYDTRT